MENNISLFSDDGMRVALPKVSDEEVQKQQGLMTEDISEIISAETISPLRIKEGILDTENYVFDYSRVQTVSIFEKNVLKSILDAENGDISIYLYNRNDKLSYIGKGERYRLARILPLLKNNVFSAELNILKDYVAGSSDVQLVTSKDITKLRLKL